MVKYAPSPNFLFLFFIQSRWWKPVSILTSASVTHTMWCLSVELTPDLRWPPPPQWEQLDITRPHAAHLQPGYWFICLGNTLTVDLQKFSSPEDGFETKRVELMCSALAYYSIWVRREVIRTQPQSAGRMTAVSVQQTSDKILKCTDISVKTSEGSIWHISQIWISSIV